jgi:GNAT superfamily N-acetyltransferase
MKKLLRELEEAVVDAWPAEETQDLDGWLLRSSGGPSHRANSVATLDAGDTPLPTRIATAEAWYRERNQLPMFQVGPCAEPAELEQALTERGYRKEGEAAACVADPREVAARTKTRLATRVDTKPTEAWTEVAVRSSRFASSADGLMAILRRLGTRCRYALAYDAQDKPSAACLGISSEDRLGIYAMFTLPHQRRKGGARALLNALAKSALGDEMRELYLLVELENSPARALYAQAGFQDLYVYHYRVSEDGKRGAAFC